MGLLVAASASAAAPPGFVDGQWEGTMVWEASVKFPDAAGSGVSSGSFSVQFSGGIPTGEFTYTADGSGETPDARAEIVLTGSGAFGGTASEPVLLPQSGQVTGTVDVFGVDTFPVEVTFGAGDFTDLPLDITTAGCSFATGLFTTQIARLDETIGGIGGSFIVPRAHWSANRVGEGGATSADQMATLNQLVADGVAISLAIDDGTYDAAALRQLLRRAEEYAAGISRNASCGIDSPGHFTTAVAGVVTEILTKMVANEELFDAQQFWSAVLAGVESGAVGSNAGPAGEALTLDLRNALWSKFSAAVAGANAVDLYAIHYAALSLGDEELAGEALNEASKL